MSCLEKDLQIFTGLSLLDWVLEALTTLMVSRREARFVPPWEGYP